VHLAAEVKLWLRRKVFENRRSEEPAAGRQEAAH